MPRADVQAALLGRLQAALQLRKLRLQAAHARLVLLQSQGIQLAASLLDNTSIAATMRLAGSATQPCLAIAAGSVQVSSPVTASARSPSNMRGSVAGLRGMNNSDSSRVIALSTFICGAWGKPGLMEAPSAGAPAPPRRPPRSPRPGPSGAAAALAAAPPPGPLRLPQRLLQAARELECALPRQLLQLLLQPSPQQLAFDVLPLP